MRGELPCLAESGTFVAICSCGYVLEGFYYRAVKISGKVRIVTADGFVLYFALRCLDRCIFFCRNKQLQE